MPYWRLSGFYFAYFAALGALLPFWGLYLQELGLSPLAIGQLMGVFMATKLLAPNLWGWIADRSAARMPFIRLAAFLTLLSFLPLFFLRDFWGIALATGLFGFFWNGLLPQMEAVTLNHLGARIHRYARIRLWGSLGFILSVLSLGGLIPDFGIGLVPWLVCLCYLGLWLSTLHIEECPPATVPEGHGNLWERIKQPEIAAFLASAFLMQMSHGTYYTFYSIHLSETGYSSLAVGALWAGGVVAEILIFLQMPRLLDRFGPRPILLTSLGLAALRWLLIGAFAAYPWVQIFAQSLHAASFGAFHAAAIYLVHGYFTGSLQGQGQALYNSLGFGAGTALGTFLSGFFWERWGAFGTFSLSALSAALGGLIAWRWVQRQEIRSG